MFHHLTPSTRPVGFQKGSVNEKHSCEMWETENKPWFSSRLSERLIRGFAKSFLVFTEDILLRCLKPLTSSDVASEEVSTHLDFLIMAFIIPASSCPTLSSWVRLYTTLPNHILHRMPQELLDSIFSKGPGQDPEWAESARPGVLQSSLDEKLAPS